jgi:two-component system phosphate regulon sensor histidine kinase PhoR
MRVADPDLRLSIVDARGDIRAGVRPAARTVSSRRRFPLLFFDPEIVELDPPRDLTTEWWFADASLTARRGVDTARVGARASLFIVSVSAIALAASLGLGARALQARSRLTETRTEFVAAVTHELKTPTATIQTISESFLRRAHIDDDTRRDYGKILFHETRRLTRLIDNLLAYSRMSDITEAYSFEPVAPGALVERGLREFRFRLEMDRFVVGVDVPADLPAVRADVAALSLALGNVIDNAIRYSDERRTLRVRARRTGGEVTIEVADAGVGIAADQLALVTQKFFRGRGAVSGGTGLGLAIAERILGDHGGRLTIRSELGVGTTVTLALPVASEASDDAHPDC